MYTCGKCDGTGKIHEYGHIAQGICFECGGAGKVTDRTKAKGGKDNWNRLERDLNDYARFYTAEEWVANLAWAKKKFELQNGSRIGVYDAVQQSARKRGANY